MFSFAVQLATLLVNAGAEDPDNPRLAVDPNTEYIDLWSYKVDAPVVQRVAQEERNASRKGGVVNIT